MEQIPNEPRSISVSIHLYSILLRLYPSKFRNEYGWLMAQAFGDCCRRVVLENGPLGLFTLWVRTMLDMLATAIEEHTQKGTDMSQEKFTRLSGWAFILGGITFLVGWLASLRPDYDPRNYFSLGIDRIANAISGPLIFSTLLLISIGMIGLLVRFNQVNGLSRVWLIIGAISGIVSALTWALVDMIGILILNTDASWFIFVYGMGLMFAGIAVWGIECLRRRYLRRGNALALFAGLWFPLFLLVSGIYELIVGNWIDNLYFVDWILFVFTAVGLAGLGIQLQSEFNQQTASATT